MWVNETIFSEGDLMNTEEYEKFISEEYQGNHSDRLEHVKNMLERLQAEQKILENEPINFYDTEHENAFYDILNRMKKIDCYHQAVAYLFSLDIVCREHLDDLFDFDENLIKKEGLHNGWQTGTSRKTTHLAFNLWNGCTSDGDTYLDENGRKSDLPSSEYSVAEIFCCSYAPYYYEAIKLRYPEYAN